MRYSDMWFYGNTIVAGNQNIYILGIDSPMIRGNTKGMKVERNYGACEAYELHHEIAGMGAAAGIAEVRRRLALIISGQGLRRDYSPRALVGDLFATLSSPVGGKAAARISYAGKGVQGTLRYQHEDVPSHMHLEAHHRWEVRLTLRGEESPFFSGLHQALMEYVNGEREKREMPDNAVKFRTG